MINTTAKSTTHIEYEQKYKHRQDITDTGV